MPAYQPLENFEEERRKVLLRYEKPRDLQEVHDSNGIPAIGVEYSLFVKNKENQWMPNGHVPNDWGVDRSRWDIVAPRVAREMNQNQGKASEESINELKSLIGRQSSDRVNEVYQRSIERHEKMVLERMQKHIGAEAEQLFNSLKESREMLGLTTLAYNTPSLIGQKLTRALAQGDRAEAWFEVRYQSNGGKDESVKGGIAKRRFVEADDLSPYADRAQPTLKESLDLYRVYTDRKSVIGPYENRYAKNMKDAASEFGARTLDETLAPAKALIIDRLIRAAPELEKVRNALEAVPATDLKLDGSRLVISVKEALPAGIEANAQLGSGAFAFKGRDIVIDIGALTGPGPVPSAPGAPKPAAATSAAELAQPAAGTPAVEVTQPAAGEVTRPASAPAPAAAAGGSAPDHGTGQYAAADTPASAAATPKPPPEPPRQAYEREMGSAW